MRDSDLSESGPHLDFGLQTVVAGGLSDLAVVAFEPEHVLREDSRQKDHVSVALLDKARTSFEAIRVLCEHLLVGDARVVIRSMVEAIINGAYIAHSGDQAADDFLDFPDYWSWTEYTEMREVEPKLAGVFARDEIEAMKQRYEELTHRFKGFKRGEWCAENMFKRASVLDSLLGEGPGLFRILVNLIWRPASAYVHGSAQSVGVRRDDSKTLARTQRTPSEAARTLYMGNTLMMVWFACLPEDLNKNHQNRLEDLLRQMKG